jgi:tRNA (adenine57-N1/adenine58-N1)-methyltransferase
VHFYVFQYREVVVKSKRHSASFVSLENWVALEEDSGKIFLVEMVDDMTKIKGLGVFNPSETIGDTEIGDEIIIGQKILTRLSPRLPELYKGMKRRAQTISAKDAGVLIARLGIGPGDVILEAGLGSGGLSLHLARVLGNSGTLITIETRDEHAEVGLENLSRAKQCLPEFPKHHHISGDISDVSSEIIDLAGQVDGIILDLPNHEPAINAVIDMLRPGGRIACYCPVTSQVERAWEACEANNLHIEWAGELMERQWGKASKGGIRPVNGPFGHTAFLLIAHKN